MMNVNLTTVNEEELQQLLDSGGPGAVLRLVREGKQLVLDDIAKETLIPVRKLAALEDDDYAQLGAETFVIAYLRKYGRILELNADELVDALVGKLHPTQNVIGSATVVPDKALAVKGERRYKKFPLHWYVAGLAVVWIGVVMVFGGDDSEQASDAVGALLGPESSLVVDSVGVEVAVAEDTELSGELEQSNALMPANDASAAETVSTLAASAGRDLVESVEAPVDETPVAVTDIAATDIVATEHLGDILIFNFSDDCWVQVTDATGEVLIAKSKHAGDNLQLFGKAPFNVMLGNARAADISINGEPYSIVPVAGHNSLRFKVSP